MEPTDAPRAARVAGERPLGSRPHLSDNRLLATLPGEVQRHLQPQLERVRLPLRHVLYDADQPIEHVHFPIDGVVSLFTVVGGGTHVEVATVGNEGLVGVSVFLGAASIPGRATSQIEGDAWRMPARAFREETRRAGPLRDLLQRYVQAYIDQLNQSAGCARAHSLAARCARSLLVTHDRVGGDRFVLTQESLASMLGVRRATVSLQMSVLRQASIVSYSRGTVTVLGRARLETGSCACYRLMKAAYERLLGGAATAP